MLYILEIGGRMLLLSGLMILAYVLFLRSSAGYRVCRRFLLSIPVLCLAIPAVHLACVRLSELHGPQQVVLTKTEAEEYMRANSEVDAPGPVLQATRQAVADGVSAASPFLPDLLPWAIPAVSCILLLVMGVQIVALRIRCRRMARNYSGAGGDIVHSQAVGTPFSFGKRIFMPAERMTAGGERLVVIHERAHIRLGHLPEGLFMEVMCRIMWFNPFVWIARKELRDVQEFEADREVIDAGTDILSYQTLLLEETMKECPVFADGFNRSFIRRRFLEMKSTRIRINSAALRYLTVLFVAVVTALTSAAGRGDRPVELRIVDDAAASHIPAMSASAVDEPVAEKEDEEEKTAQSSDDAAVVGDGNDRPSTFRGYPLLYELPLATEGAFISMRNTDSETFLVFEEAVDRDRQFFKFAGPESYIVDCATGIHYQARRSIPEDAWGCFFLCGMAGRRITVTVVFPRLPDSVEVIGLYGITDELQSDLRFRVKDILER